MFDYIKNRYNPKPIMVKQNDINEDNLYIKFLNAPYMILPKTIDEFLDLHKSKFWYNLNRFEKMFQQDFGELYFEIIKDEQQLDIFLDKVFSLFNEKWKNEYLSTPWKCKNGFEIYKHAMIDLANTDEAFLAVLYDENKNLLSYAYCLNNYDTVYFYQYTTDPESKYKKYSLGKVLVHNLLKYVISEQKYKKFDFMNGEQSYKLEWAKDKEEVFLKVEGKNIFSYIKWILLKLKIYIQFNDFFRGKVKKLFKLKENFFGKC